ncbi:MAG: ABC transporter ATP-binding protein [candidate division Zixibacteria bacterium]|nr:ABC transporter ATP-binding protein [candidate division Zixibacteria bacterium]
MGITIEAKGLVRRFGAFTAVDGVSFAVQKGEIFGFLGPNGAGKSTTIKMLCGILAPSSGELYVGGVDVRAYPEEAKHRIGYMSQKFSLYEDLTVWENIEFYSGIYRLPAESKRERMEAMLALSGLEEEKDRLAGELPGGYKQRLALGCALLHDPPIIFLDEPTAGVDPVSRRTFWELIARMAQEGKTIFVTTHYMDEAEHCDRLALINNGKIVASGTPTQLKAQQTGILLEVATSEPIRAFALVRRELPETSPALFGSLLHLTVFDRAETERKLRSVFEKEGIVLESVETIASTLEDVFCQVMESSEAGSR